MNGSQSAINCTEDYRHATYVDDRACEAATIDDLVRIDAAAADEFKVFYLFLADTVTMTGVEQPLLAVDLNDEPGRSFRVPPRWYGEISDNLAIGNLGFADFADATDGDGTYRGFVGDA